MMALVFHMSLAECRLCIVLLGRFQHVEVRHNRPSLLQGSTMPAGPSNSNIIVDAPKFGAARAPSTRPQPNTKTRPIMCFCLLLYTLV